jgi:hypothetical protein
MDSIEEHRLLSTPASRNGHESYLSDCSSSLHRQKSGPRQRARPHPTSKNPPHTPTRAIYKDKLDPSALHFRALWRYMSFTPVTKEGVFNKVGKERNKVGGQISLVKRDRPQVCVRPPPNGSSFSPRDHGDYSLQANGLLLLSPPISNSHRRPLPHI